MTCGLIGLHQIELAFRQNSREDRIVFETNAIGEAPRRTERTFETDGTRDRKGRRGSVARDHHHFDAKRAKLLDEGRGVVPGGIGQHDQADQSQRRTGPQSHRHHAHALHSSSFAVVSADAEGSLRAMIVAKAPFTMRKSLRSSP